MPKDVIIFLGAMLPPSGDCNTIFMMSMVTKMEDIMTQLSPSIQIKFRWLAGKAFPKEKDGSERILNLLKKQTNKTI